MWLSRTRRTDGQGEIYLLWFAEPKNALVFAKNGTAIFTGDVKSKTLTIFSNSQFREVFPDFGDIQINEIVEVDVIIRRKECQVTKS